MNMNIHKTKTFVWKHISINTKHNSYTVVYNSNLNKAVKLLYLHTLKDERETTTTTTPACPLLPWDGLNTRSTMLNIVWYVKNKSVL